MFSSEFNGYKKEEVDKYLAKINAQYEASLMEEKLKVLAAERKLLDFKNKSYEIENRERNIMSALDAFRKYQDEGNNTIKALHYEQIKMINEQLQFLYKQISIKFPEIQNMHMFKSVFEDLERILSQAETHETEITSPAQTENDSMRMLLNKMQGYRKVQDTPKEIKITRQEESNAQIEPFDIRAAINPKDDLAEIMKAFDFYNDGEN